MNVIKEDICLHLIRVLDRCQAMGDGNSGATFRRGVQRLRANVTGERVSNYGKSAQRTRGDERQAGYVSYLLHDFLRRRI